MVSPNEAALRRRRRAVIFPFCRPRGAFFSPLSFCLRRVTFFPWRKKVTKERHLRKGGFRFPPFLKVPFPLKRPKGRGCDPSPLETSPWGGGDYQIAPLPRSGKGRWRPLAAVFVNAFALRRKIVQPCISERKRQRKEKQRQCNI